MCFYIIHLKTIAQNNTNTKGEDNANHQYILEITVVTAIVLSCHSIATREQKICIKYFRIWRKAEACASDRTLWPTRIAFFSVRHVQTAHLPKAQSMFGIFLLLPRFEAEFLFTTRLTCALAITKYVAVRNMCVFCIFLRSVLKQSSWLCISFSPVKRSVAGKRSSLSSLLCVCVCRAVFPRPTFRNLSNCPHHCNCYIITVLTFLGFI